jgi:hypothetical protein
MKYGVQWLSGLRRGSAANRLLGLQVRIPPARWMSVVKCCVVSGRVFLRRADPLSRGVLPTVVRLNEFHEAVLDL